ncbi:pyruvate ferredoxin oxidoreductase [Candidatus Falkowbacteria bacterium]|nr:pyruvate ferredoxin oxidoreductase [Candidatus Falkowbacteria bacterium]
MLKFMEGSRAIAETVKLCRPDVVAAYPITPQTHILENLAEFKAEGQANFEYLKTESEMAAASAVLGASAAGARVYTASASQGLLLMTEVLFNIAGMRLPVVMTCANRAVSAPINIWNDEQDAMTLRDAGWMMFFAEDNQEAADLHILSYKIAEATNLPVMVCMDGFSLTHTFEPVEIRDQKLVDKFLPRRKLISGQYLNPQNPITLGGISSPENYMPAREKLHQDLIDSKKMIQKFFTEFNKLFIKRKNYNGFIEYSGPRNPKLMIIAMGSVLGTAKTILNKEKLSDKVGVLKIKCFRPFPDAEISKIILSIRPKHIAVVDRAVSLGQGGILAGEIKNLCPIGMVSNFIVGLGGRDITPEHIEKIVKLSLNDKACTTRFYDK